MELNLKDDVVGFLDVLIEKLETNKIELTHTGLIKQILQAMDIEGANLKAKPAKTEALPVDKLGNPTQASFKNASIVGMLQFLQGRTRPDITFAVSQCTR